MLERLGCEITIRRDSIGRMSCNPAVGGLAKGQLAREVDALGEGLAHPEDAAATQLHTRVDRETGGRDAVVVRVRGADRREPRSRCLEVVVVAPHA